MKKKAISKIMEAIQLTKIELSKTKGTGTIGDPADNDSPSG